jgi:hypothetical protein
MARCPHHGENEYCAECLSSFSPDQREVLATPKQLHALREAVKMLVQQSEERSAPFQLPDLRRKNEAK